MNVIFTAIHAGEKTILFAKYNGKVRPFNEWAQLHPFVLTDYGYCSHIDASMLFHPVYGNLSYSEMWNRKISPVRDHLRDDHEAYDEDDEFKGVKVGKRQGLQLLIDVEAYDYGFAPDEGEGVKIGIGNFGDEPRISVDALDFEAGSVHHVIISPVLTTTTVIAKNRFEPSVRGCYFQDEFKLKDYSDRSSR